MEKTVEIERSIIKKYKKPIWHRFIGGCKDYRLVNAGDRIAVCISGGKDSFLLAKCTATFRLNWNFCVWTRATARKTAP